MSLKYEYKDFLDWDQLGRRAINATHKAGFHDRNEPLLDEVKAEIDKLSSLQGAGKVDWDKVFSLSVEILQSKSKDLLVACYLSLACINLDGLNGFAKSLGVIEDLLLTFWETMYPPLERSRARGVSLIWWQEKSIAFLKIKVAKYEVSETVEEVRFLMKTLDVFLESKMEDAPSLHYLSRFVEGLPTFDREKINEQRKAEAKKVDAAKSDKTEGTSSSSVPSSIPATIPLQEPLELVPANNYHTILRRLKDVLRSGKEALVLGEGQNLLKAVTTGIRETVKLNPKADYRMPEFYRMSRLVGYGSLFKLPENSDGITQIAPPSMADRDIIEQLREDEKWEALLPLSEGKLMKNNFWLDLHLYTAEALERMGEAYAEAHREVSVQALSLFLRLPGIESLKFADGTPFANKHTIFWLKRIDNRLAIPLKKEDGRALKIKETSHRNIVDQINERVEELLEFSGYQAAVEFLQSVNTNDFTSEEKFSWHLSLCKTLISAKKGATVFPRLEAIEKQVRQHDLETWNPRLALEALKVLWEGYITSESAEVRQRAPAIMTRISVLNSYEALQLEDRVLRKEI